MVVVRRWGAMEVLVERCAGLDIGKKQVQASIRVPDGEGGRRKETRTYSTFTPSIETMAQWLADEGVTEVVMESTGPFWKPIWYVLEERGFDLKLVNSRHVRILPGRKTDVKDAEWLAELLEHGLLRGSFVPPPAIRKLRDLTRYRKRLIQTRADECQRIQKTLEDAGIKLSSVATDILGVSGTAMLKALVAGERNPEVLAELARGRMRSKVPELTQALRGRFSEHHALLIRISLDLIDHLDTAIATLDGQVEAAMAPFAEAAVRIDTVTGVGQRAAECIIAEIGADMSVFPTASHLASWAGCCPGNNITGGKRRSGKTNKGDQWLNDVLIQCAWAAAHSHDTYLSAQFWHLARRIGKKKAAVAVAHSILVIIWHLLTNHCDYQDLGGDYFVKRDAERQRDRAVNELMRLGYKVTLEEAYAA